MRLTRLKDIELIRHGQLVKVNGFVTDSNSQPQLFHDVEIYQDAGGDWWGSCDEGSDSKFACKANQLGGRLCSHLARCVVDLGLLERKG